MTANTIQKNIKQELSALICKGSFFYLITDVFHDSVVEYGLIDIPPNATKLTWQNLLNKHKLNKDRFEKSCVAFAESRMTLIPSELFKKTELSTYLNASHSMRAEEVAMSDHFKGLGIHCVYAANEDLISVLNEELGQVKYIHISNGLVNHFRRITPGKLGHKLLIHVLPTQLVFVLLNGTKLEFVKYADYSSIDDFLYHSLLFMNDNRLDPELCPVHLSGHFSEQTEYFPKLYRYVRYLEQAKLYKNVKLGQVEKDYEIFDLFSSLTCV